MALLDEQAKTRVPELVPIRYGRMLVSPFTFFRGAAYSIVASFAVAGRDRGLGAKRRRETNRGVAKAYREAIRNFARLGTLDIWYARQDVDDGRQAGRALRARYCQGSTRTSLRAFEKLAEIVDGRRRIASDPPVVLPIEEAVPPEMVDQLSGVMSDVINSYKRTLAGDRRRLLERFEYVHAARKLVGVGSVGTRAWIMLHAGRDADDPLVLQFRQAEAPSSSGFFQRAGTRITGSGSSRASG